MIDYFDINNNSLFNQIFYTKGSTDWQVWNKPNGVRMVNILCIGGGGGGGSGFNAASGTTRGGGGGGASSCFSIGLFSAYQIPDTLFIQVGVGGAGGTIGTTSNGTSGGISYVSVQPNTTSINMLLQSSNTVAGFGSSGGSGGGGSQGVAGAIWSGSVLNDLGLVSTYAGQNGTSGLTNAIPISVSITNILSGGSGGAGTNLSATFSGGSITGTSFIPNINGGANSVSTPATNGDGGYTSMNNAINSSINQPIFFTGGAGGGSSNTSSGGSGGNASFGCGGGGGGAGVTNQAGGGGKGGDGLVIINCF